MSQPVFVGRKIRVERAEITLPDGERRVREVVRHPGAVAVVPILPDGRIVLLNHWRSAVGGELIEIPAGTLEPGEEPLACARRELEEETGWIAGRLTPLASFHSAPGFCDEILHLFLAEDLTPGRVNLDPGERLEPFSVSPAEAERLLHEGRIRDAKTLVGLLLVLEGGGDGGAERPGA